MMHVAFLGDGAARMEGIRVHPDYRRLGLATAMDAAGRAYAHQRGGKLRPQNVLCDIGAFEGVFAQLFLPLIIK